MTEINVRGQKLVQAQLKKVDAKVVVEGEKETSFKDINELIKLFQDGKITFSEFKENAEKLGATNFNVTNLSATDGRVKINFKIGKKNYTFNVPKSYIKNPSEPNGNTSVLTVNSSNNINSRNNEYAIDLEKKMAEYADMKNAYENHTGSPKEKINLLKSMQNLIRQVLDKHFHFVNDPKLKDILMNDYVNWNAHINKLRLSNANTCSDDRIHVEVRTYLNGIDPDEKYISDEPFSEVERILEPEQKTRFYNNELWAISNILDKLHYYKKPENYDQLDSYLQDIIDSYIKFYEDLLRTVKSRTGEDTQLGLRSTLNYSDTHGYRYDTPEEAWNNFEKDLRQTIVEWIAGDMMADNILDGDKTNLGLGSRVAVSIRPNGGSIDCHAGEYVLSHNIDIYNFRYEINSYKIIEDNGKFMVIADVTIKIEYRITTTPEIVPSEETLALNEYNNLKAQWYTPNKVLTQEEKIELLKKLIDKLLDLNNDELSGDFVEWNRLLNQIKTEGPEVNKGLPAAWYCLDKYILEYLDIIKPINGGYSPMTHVDYYAEIPDGLSKAEKFKFFSNEIETITDVLSNLKKCLKHCHNKELKNDIESMINTYERMLRAAKEKLRELNMTKIEVPTSIKVPSLKAPNIKAPMAK